MTDPTVDFDTEVDVVVLGTGGAGLTAALATHDFGAGEVLILEKSGMVGGTTAMSGGMLWIPLNDQQAEHVEDRQRQRVGLPSGAYGGVDARDTEDRVLDAQQPAGQPALRDRGHPAAERPAEADQQRHVDDEFDPGGGVHQNSSAFSSA